MTSQCSCARGERFHRHLSVDCPGGFFAFSPTTYFEREEQVIPALLHAAKGRLLSSLRASPVYYDCLVRVTADSDAPEYLRVVATYSNFRSPLSSRLLIAPTLVDSARVLQVPRPTAIKLAA